MVSRSPHERDTTWTSHTDYAWDTRLLFKRRITNLYVLAFSLKSYAEMNYSGFRKILKKCVDARCACPRADNW